MRLGATYLLLLSLLLTPVRGQAQTPPPTEQQIKAAFIFNFAKFVEWPSSVFSNASTPLVIGVLGENPFGTVLEQTVRNKAINDRTLEVKEFHHQAEVTNCHILFISTSEKKRLPEILTALRREGVLTVSEMDGFIEAGGMINFVKESNKIRFQINEPAAKKSKLKVSSKLLSLAVPLAP